MAQVQAQAHSLRGTAGYLGAIGMTSALEALEQATRADGDRDEARRHAATARDAFLRVQGRLLTKSAFPQ
jgi:HPt (histidine-containing phosphotransfer) domain-containing protein